MERKERPDLSLEFERDVVRYNRIDLGKRIASLLFFIGLFGAGYGLISSHNKNIQEMTDRRRTAVKECIDRVSDTSLGGGDLGDKLDKKKIFDCVNGLVPKGDALGSIDDLQILMKPDLSGK